MIVFGNPERMKQEIIKSGEVKAVHKYLHSFSAIQVMDLFKSVFPDSWQDIMKSWEKEGWHKVPQSLTSRMYVFDNKHALANGRQQSREAKTLVFKRR